MHLIYRKLTANVNEFASNTVQSEVFSQFQRFLHSRRLKKSWLFLFCILAALLSPTIFYHALPSLLTSFQTSSSQTSGLINCTFCFMHEKDYHIFDQPRRRCDLHKNHKQNKCKKISNPGSGFTVHSVSCAIQLYELQSILIKYLPTYLQVAHIIPFIWYRPGRGP